MQLQTIGSLNGYLLCWTPSVLVWLLGLAAWGQQKHWDRCCSVHECCKRYHSFRDEQWRDQLLRFGQIWITPNQKELAPNDGSCTFKKSDRQNKFQHVLTN